MGGVMGTNEIVETVCPASEVEVARVLADASGRGRKVAVRGGGTKADWGGPAE